MFRLGHTSHSQSGNKETGSWRALDGTSGPTYDNLGSETKNSRANLSGRVLGGSVYYAGIDVYQTKNTSTNNTGSGFALGSTTSSHTVGSTQTTEIRGGNSGSWYGSKLESGNSTTNHTTVSGTMGQPFSGMTQTGFNMTTLYGTAAQTGITGMYSYGQRGTGGSFNSLQTGVTVTPGPVVLPPIAGLPNYPTAGGYPTSQSGVVSGFVTPMGNYYSGGYGAGGGFGASGGQLGYGGYRPQINPMGGYGARGGEGGSRIPPGHVPKYKLFEEDISLAREALKGVGQGGANILNGLQDSMFSLINSPASFINGIAWLEEKIGILDETKPIRIPYIPSPDWSKGLVFDEGDSSHNAGKFIGAAGVELLAGALITKLSLTNRTANSGLKSYVPNGGNLVSDPVSNSWTSIGGLEYGQG